MARSPLTRSLRTRVCRLLFHVFRLPCMNSTSHNLARFVMEVKSLLGWLGERETQRLVMRHIYVVGCQAASSFCEKRRRNPPDSRGPLTIPTPHVSMRPCTATHSDRRPNLSTGWFLKRTAR